MFKRILHIGIHPEIDFYQQREVKILNSLALVIIFGLLVGATNIFFLHELYPAVAESLIAISSMFIIVLNWKRQYELAAYVYVVVINLTLFFVSQYYEDVTGTYLYYFPVIFCIAILHNPIKKNSRTFAFFSITLISFLATRIINIPFLSGTHFTTEQNNLLLLYNIYFCVILTIALVYYFIRMLNKQYFELAELVQKTKNDQLVISNSLREKEILLKEVQHRVKNNLAVIMALFNFQKESSTNEETKIALTEARNRVLSIAMVHEQLYKKDNFSKIHLDKYIPELIQEVLRSHPLHSHANIKKELESIDLDITKTIPVGLIINEIVTNSLKHGFKNSNNTPEIAVKLRSSNGWIYIDIKDNGTGFPEKIEKNQNSLGISLMESLTEQIDGKIELTSDSGALVKLSFPALSA
ncbi:MAG: sensor histidine kinase [Sphingobacteriaceae bacterium]